MEIQKAGWEPNMIGFAENGFEHRYGLVQLQNVEIQFGGQDFDEQRVVFRFGSSTSKMIQPSYIVDCGFEHPSEGNDLFYCTKFIVKFSTT